MRTVRRIVRYPLTVALAAPAWVPTSLPGLAVLLDSSNLATITSSGGTASVWADPVGGFNVSQLTGGNQPGTGSHTSPTGKNLLDFSGSKFMDMASSVGLSQPFSSFQVYKPFSTSAQRIWDSVLSGPRSLLNPSGGSFGMYSGNPADAVATATGMVCHMTVHNGSSSVQQINSTLYTSQVAGANGLGQVEVGHDAGGTFVDGDIALIGFCSGDQSTSFATFLAYAQTFWGSP